MKILKIAVCMLPLVAQVWDLTTEPCKAISRSGKPLNWFKRDPAHNDDRGKQLIAQTLAAYFRAIPLEKGLALLP